MAGQGRRWCREGRNQLPAPLLKSPQGQDSHHHCAPGGGALHGAPRTAGSHRQAGRGPAALSRRPRQVPTICAPRPCRPVGPVPASARAPPHGLGFGGDEGRADLGVGGGEARTWRQRQGLEAYFGGKT